MTEGRVRARRRREGPSGGLVTDTLPTDPEGQFEQVVELVEGDGEPGPVLAAMAALRLGGDAALGNRLDEYLVLRCARLRQAGKRLEATQAELRESLQQLLQPPLFPVLYTGSVRLPDGEYASVLHEGSRRVVTLAQEVSARDLEPGEEVYLCRERNAVIARAQEGCPGTGDTAELLRPLGEDRLVLSDRDAEVVISRGGALADTVLSPGDRIIWDRGARIALARLGEEQTQDYEEVDGRWCPTLGGMDDLAQSVFDRFLFCRLHPETARRYGLGEKRGNRLLLHGPPGMGKTTMMRAIAARIARASGQPCRVVAVTGAQLYSSWVGETERNIRRRFTVLRDHDGPGILFLDEIDGIARIRGHAAGHHDDRALATLLGEIEGLTGGEVTVIAATNRPDMLDPALRSRFSWELPMLAPGMAAAAEIFAVHLPQDLPYRPNGAQAPATRQALIDAGVAALFDPNADNRIASLQFRDGRQREIVARELVSGRMIEQICSGARAAAFERQCRGGSEGIVLEDLREAVSQAIERLRGTLTPGNARSFIGDLEQDVDVVSVVPLRAAVEAGRYGRDPAE